MMIYLVAIMGAILAELIRYSAKQKSYPTFYYWFNDRWDNLAIAIVGAVLLAGAWGEVECQVSAYVSFDLTNSPKTAGLVIGLCSTPIINFIKNKVNAKTQSI
jgi:hypothetical protein